MRSQAASLAQGWRELAPMSLLISPISKLTNLRQSLLAARIANGAEAVFARCGFLDFCTAPFVRFGEGFRPPGGRQNHAPARPDRDDRERSCPPAGRRPPK